MSLPLSDDWAAQAADAVERAVGTARDRITGPALRAARALVFGLLALIVGTAGLVLICVLLIRVLDLLPGGVWVAYLIAGTLFTAVGFVLWSRRRPPVEETL